ncbi:MAG: hypothetical protein IKG15_09430 [Solobacterium sp.]|nr:hypothetical protein [Solobacterium sp.]
MRQFDPGYPKFRSVNVKLTWTHDCGLMSISVRDRLSFYEKECERSGWSFREMKRQISASINISLNLYFIISQIPVFGSTEYVIPVIYCL